VTAALASVTAIGVFAPRVSSARHASWPMLYKLLTVLNGGLHTVASLSQLLEILCGQIMVSLRMKAVAKIFSVELFVLLWLFGSSPVKSPEEEKL